MLYTYHLQQQQQQHDGGSTEYEIYIMCLQIMHMITYSQIHMCVY